MSKDSDSYGNEEHSGILTCLILIPLFKCRDHASPHLRSKGAAITTFSNWLWNFATVMMTPSLMSIQSRKGYLVFCILNFIFVQAIDFFYPETSRRRLEQIDAIFYKTSPIIAGIQWAKKGKYEFDSLEAALGEHEKNADLKHVEVAALGPLWRV